MSWTWSLNWNDVTAALVVGTCPMTPDDLARIHTEAGVSAVLSVQHDDCLAYWSLDYDVMKAKGRALGLVMRRAPMRDFDLEDQQRHLPYAVAALTQLRADGHRVYVHCTAGLGRAPLTVLGYLALVEGRDPHEAIRLIQARRPGAVPSWEAYAGCRKDLIAALRPVVEQRAHERYERGEGGTAEDHWFHAEEEVLRAALRSLASVAPLHTERLAPGRKTSEADDAEPNGLDVLHLYVNALPGDE